VRPIQSAIFIGEASVKFILMLKIVHIRAMNLRQRETGKVDLYLLWRLANEKIALGRAYEEISIHGSPFCREILFLDHLRKEIGALAVLLRPR
jgi:hypothetical protein